jgi:hypothetical protein
MKIDNNKTFDNDGHVNDFIADVSGSYSLQMEKLQERLKDAERRYVYGKNTVEQNNANFDMMIVLNEIKKLKGID